MSATISPTQHPHRVLLHNEIHARPPEAMSAPLAIAHIVMLADAAEREASRAHVAALLRDHHLALPDAGTTHLRMDLGAFRLRWELHTEFVSWTFMVPAAVESFGEREPVSAIASVPREWLAALPGQCLCSLNLWVLPTHTFGSGSLIKHVLHEDTLVASTVADGHGEVYTDFAIHPDGYSRMVLLAGGMTPRRLGRLVQRLQEIETYRMAALLGLPAAREATSVLASAERELAELADAIRTATGLAYKVLKRGKGGVDHRGHQRRIGERGAARGRAARLHLPRGHLLHHTRQHLGRQHHKAQSRPRILIEHGDQGLFGRQFQQFGQRPLFHHQGRDIQRQFQLVPRGPSQSQPPAANRTGIRANARG